MKKIISAILSVTAFAAVIFGTLYIIDHKRMENNESVLFSTWGAKYAPALQQNLVQSKEQNETPITGEQSFVGTIVEETNTSLVVVPNADEIEREISERITVQLPYENKDYFYGEGRKVVIYYTVSGKSTGTSITADKISTEGFTDFELSVELSKQKNKRLILQSDEIDNFISFGHINDVNLYYYGLSEVNVFVDNQTVSLVEALESGKLTLNAIIRKANTDAENKIIEKIEYDDGGSSVYRYPDYTIVKYHTIDGNRDFYIGSADTDINIADK